MDIRSFFGLRQASSNITACTIAGCASSDWQEAATSRGQRLRSQATRCNQEEEGRQGFILALCRVVQDLGGLKFPLPLRAALIPTQTLPLPLPVILHSDRSALSSLL